MSIGAGIAAQIGVVQEVTPGTPVTVTRFYEFDSESLAMKKGVVQGGGMRPDKTYDRASRRNTVKRDVQGDINLQVPIKGLGLLLQNMLGSFAATATQQGATTAYKQIHTPGAFTGKALTIQKGAPRTDGTVTPVTYPGCKITAWELACAQSEIARLKLSIDAMDELTPNSTPAGPALASASYSAGQGNFTFVQGALLSGGTASTAGGLTSVSGGVAVAAVRSITVGGSNPVAADRFFLGSAIKAEQIQNAYNTVTGQMVVEFASTALYDQYRADTGAAIHLSFTSNLLAGVAFPFLLDIIIPVAYLEDGATPMVGGPDVLQQTIPFTGLDDGTNPAIQFVYVSTDTTV